MTKFEIVRDVILLILALFGAGLSLFNYFDARKKERRVLTIKLGSALPVFGTELGATFVRLTATNTGSRPVTLVHLGLELDGGSRLGVLEANLMPGVEDTRLPVVLADGQQATIHVPYADIGQGLLSSGRTGKVRLTPVGEDSSGQRHVGKGWTVDPHEWKGM